MIPIFRKIRKKMADDNRPLKYFRYALGEIVLVVIGILIALQVNNWNEVRKQKAQVGSYTRAMISDLKEDIKQVRHIKFQAEKSYIGLDSLINYCRYLDIEDMSNLELFLLSSGDGYKPYSWNRASFEEIKSSGILSYFKNDRLINLLVKYEAFTNHMDLDYQEDIESKAEARKLLNRVVNRNYSLDLDNLQLIASVGPDSLKMIDFSKSKIYIELKNQSIDFISKDEALLQEAINTYIEYNENLNTRYDFELPKLLKDAESIIQILEDNYLD